ncbi:GtrA family protein [Aliikangiella maris]|uniref:GtrA family protein n=2 Tax=Aliikangiella maris TaxID=3162458 RepID=A0ABV3MP29_9GAMM
MDYLLMLPIKYIFFAIIAILINLLFQYLSFKLYMGFGSLYIAMFVGTLTGLIAKYILDKKYIFYHHPSGKADEVKKFILYSIMGIITTGIFWGTEVAFDLIFSYPNAKYLGAIIGLSIGYIIKYFLDRKYVFIVQKEMEV